MLYDESTVGQTFELYGPKEYKLAEIAAMVDKEIFQKRRHINVPKAILQPVANILNKALYWKTLSADEVEREFLDQVIDPEAKTFKDLGIEPGDIANFTYHYLVCHRLSIDHNSCSPGSDRPRSKASVARTTTTSLRQRRRRRGRRRSTSTSWMSCERDQPFDFRELEVEASRDATTPPGSIVPADVPVFAFRHVLQSLFPFVNNLDLTYLIARNVSRSTSFPTQSSLLYY